MSRITHLAGHQNPNVLVVASEAFAPRAVAAASATASAAAAATAAVVLAFGRVPAIVVTVRLWFAFHRSVWREFCVNYMFDLRTQNPERNCRCLVVNTPHGILQNV